MAIELKMPALSPTMEKGTLARWLVSEGDAIKVGDLIAEIETDKATMELEADEQGIITQLVVPAGSDDVPVGTVLALLRIDSEDGRSDVTPVAAVTSDVASIAKTSTPSQFEDTKVSTPTRAVLAIPDTVATTLDMQANASPLARRIAAAKNINLSTLVGSGPRGRIVRSDLGGTDIFPTALPTASTVPAPVALFAPPPADVPVTTQKLSGMRKTIARRLSESKQTVPHFYLTVRCNIDPLLNLRADLNRQLGDRGIKLSVNDFMIKALATALHEVPEANVQYGGDVLHSFGRADISMAVAIEGGLVTPVIRDAGSLSVSAIAAQSKAIAAKARDGKLSPEEYQGGTASLSNLGMFGVDEMFPVINPPQALIMGIAAGIEQPWKVDGAISLATIMAATASFDHRAIDGAIAARFMASFRSLVEGPMRLLA